MDSLWGDGQQLQTAEARQGFVTSTCIVDRDEFTRRTMQAAEGGGNWIKAFPSGLPSNLDLDYGFHVGEPVFRKVGTSATVYEQYPRVFTSFTNYMVSLTKVLKEDPSLSMADKSSDEVREAALRVAEDEVVFVGLSAKNVEYSPTFQNQPDGPTLALAGTIDVWNHSDTHIPQFAWVCWRMPSISRNPRSYNVQGKSPTKVTAELAVFDPKDVRPTLAHIKRKLLQPGEARDDLVEALVNFVDDIMKVARTNDQSARAWLTSDALKPKNGVVNTFLAESQAATFKALSRVVGKAITPAKPNSQFTMHMTQMAV